MLKFCRVTKVKVFFLVLLFVFNFDLFEFSAAILEKGQFWGILIPLGYQYLTISLHKTYNKRTIQGHFTSKSSAQTPFKIVQ